MKVSIGLNEMGLLCRYGENCQEKVWQECLSCLYTERDQDPTDAVIGVYAVD